MTCNIVEIGGKVNNFFKRNIYCNKNEVKSKAKQFKEDVYTTIYSYENSNVDSCKFIAPFYLDLDIDNIDDNYSKLILDLKLIINRIKKEFSIETTDIDIYFSGSKGFHIVIDSIIFGFEPSRNLNKQLKKIATDFQANTFTRCIDTKIYDYKRLFRMPNTINTKTGLYKVKIPYNKLINMSYEELKTYASKPKMTMRKPHKYNRKAHDAFYGLIEAIDKRERAKVNVQMAREFLQRKEPLPCVKYLLQNGANNGERNNCTVAIANALFQIGQSLDEVLEIIDVWNNTKNEEPLSDSEIRATVLSAQNNSNNKVCYGCSTFKDLNACVKDCPLHKK